MVVDGNSSGNMAVRMEKKYYHCEIQALNI